MLRVTFRPNRQVLVTWPESACRPMHHSCSYKSMTVSICRFCIILEKEEGVGVYVCVGGAVLHWQMNTCLRESSRSDYSPHSPTCIKTYTDDHYPTSKHASIYLTIHTSVYLSTIYPSTIYSSIYQLSIHTSTHPSSMHLLTINPSIHHSYIHPSICPSFIHL